MNYIKKMIIQVEDSDGKVWDTEIDGLLVRSIDVNYNRRYCDPFDSFRPQPVEVVIRLETYDGNWGSVRPQNQKSANPQLPSPQKKLPEHE